jgi:hypothetical protein
MASIESAEPGPRSLTDRLAAAPRTAFVAYAVASAFTTYFCMYAFRKPSDAVLFEGQKFLGTRFDLKTACVISQIVGYMLSKYIGAKVCSEVARGGRAVLLAGLVLAAEATLLLFAVLPPDWKPLALFLNGLPLGMVWGLVVRYLEGRRASEVLLVGLSGSYIIAGAAVKDVGLYLMTDWGYGEDWMPAATGALFLAPYLLAVWLLDRLPPPGAADIASRTERVPMGADRRREFLRHVGAGFVLLLVAYFFLTAYRDFRDHYGREIFRSLGYDGRPGIFTRADRWALMAALAGLALINLIRAHRRALLVVYGVIFAGFALIGLATAGFQAGWLDGLGWMSLIGVGLYLAYVPFGAILFERLVAATRFAGTSVFAVQLADGVGYTGSVLLQIYRDVAHGGEPRLAFFLPLSYVVSVAGLALTAGSAAGIFRRAR